MRRPGLYGRRVMDLPRPYAARTWSAQTPTGPDDGILDRQIRRLLDVCQMPTPILSLSYHCEPSFRRALDCQGDEHHLVFARNEAQTEITSLGIRSLRWAYLGGQPARLAYIHHLRIHPSHRGGTLLARGYQAFRAVSREFPAPLTFTSILEGNTPARELLGNPSGRGPLPRYEPVTRYLTAMIPLHGPGGRWPRRPRTVSGHGCTSRVLIPGDLPELSDLYKRFGAVNDGFPITGEPIDDPSSSLAPSCGQGSSPSPNDLRAERGRSAPGEGTDGGRTPSSPREREEDNGEGDACGSGWSLPGLERVEYLGVFRDGRLRGAVGLWDRTSCQQIRLAALHPAIEAARQAWELGSSWWGRCPLPAPGEEVPHLLLDPWAVEPGLEPLVGPVLLDAALAAARRRGVLFAAFGAPEGHPMRRVVERYVHLPYWSVLYSVRWPETPCPTLGSGCSLTVPLGTL